jgi:hypothetical protein
MQGYLMLGKWDVYTEPRIYAANRCSPAGPLHCRNVVLPLANLHTIEIAERASHTTNKKTGISEHEGSTQVIT